MDATWRALAAVPAPSDVIMPVLLGVLVLLALLLGTAMIFIYLARWAKRPESALPPSADLLSQFRLLYERGECSREEFERIRAKLGKRMREEMEVTTSPASAQDSAPGAAASEQIRLPANAVEPTIGRGGNERGPDTSIQSR